MKAIRTTHMLLFECFEHFRTCDLPTTWPASSWIGKETPSSDWNDVIGESVPLVKMTHRASFANPENTCEEATQERWRNNLP